ncbi:MAG: excinuclease ABC subunit UvrB, partial [Candidatus Pacebacteria bacterium]|nr:excinuclease ABC subunit UvrB [Candidatus Paceibacterota bacterium]
MLYKNNKFILKGSYTPAGDQPAAIKSLVQNLKDKKEKLTLLGATGTGKTFTIANVISQIQKPTLVIAHNKTLAAQLAQEFREFFPDAAVHYFVSYYDYYQPEAYMPVTDTYIEKDASINEEIDRLRHASTQALLTRKDVIICASVSCIYGLGSPVEYEKENKILQIGDKISKTELMKDFINIYYERTNADLSPGQFRSIGNRVDIMSIGETEMLQIEISGDRIEKMFLINPISMTILKEVGEYFIFPAKHFISDKKKLDIYIKNIKDELKIQLKKFDKENKLLESERLSRRTSYDLAMIKEIGYCSGIENYSRHLSGKKEGEPPETLLSYFPHNKNAKGDIEADFLTVIDESHITLPQIGAMYAGDQSRKGTLVDHGFRLPSAKDNRPLTYTEFNKRVGQRIFVSATPGKEEREEGAIIIEQIIRPTGLVDPKLEIRPIREDSESKKSYPGQIYDFINEAEQVIKKGGRVLATTLTKKMAENLSQFLKEKNMKAEYLHSDVKTIERIEILTRLRKGEIDCLVGVNLLREGLDLPEVSLIGILDADKEGFLRSDTSLIQTIGRAARNVDGRVILYADKITGSMERAIEETNRRRDIQLAYNKKNNITPTTIKKEIKDITESIRRDHNKTLT